MDYPTIWFLIVGILLTGYAILDGFDLGVGALHLLVKKDDERRLFLNAIGPVWDGNEVWLVVGGGALFAAFPEAYATVFSGFYIPFKLLLCCLIFRAVAIEFRSKEPWRWWRQMWDVAFCLSSILAAFLIGVSMGNIVRGIPLDADNEYAGGLGTLFNSYSVLLGITTVTMFSLHGAIYLALKTEGDLQAQVRSWIPTLIGIQLAAYIFFNFYTIIECPYVLEMVKQRPFIMFIMAVDVLVMLNIPREISLGREFNAFLCSCLGMILLMATFGLTYYPYMVRSHPNLENSLTIYNAASSPGTMHIMLIITIIGIPLVLSYTACIYYIFRGKSKLTAHNY
ncbi:cytochrome d ubiquinol oxidase subunit II [Verrucomicrobia bacterium LW23]|nr:cytochrome d ubiquinol oxidase subunit II [Verrucomicrobia bacterium LW23]